MLTEAAALPFAPTRMMHQTMHPHAPCKVGLLLLLVFHGGPLTNAHPQVKGDGYVTLDKPPYDEFESIAVAFALPRKRQQQLHQLERRPVHARCRSPGGALSPIISVLVHDADSCDTNEVAACAGRWNVTFGNDWRDAMRGMWPIEVKDHGIGYLAVGGRSDWAVRILHMEEGRV